MDMKSDGSKKRQITTSEGYDGGAMFSRDGKMLAWRAGHPDSGNTETLSRTAGRQSDFAHENGIVRVRCGRQEHASNYELRLRHFAPTFTPDGKKILFSSNKLNCDGRKFELFLVNTDGSDLEQVTDFGGFTSFPEFSPDGKPGVRVG